MATREEDASGVARRSLLLVWRVFKLPITVFVASPLLRAVDNPLAKTPLAEKFARTRRRAGAAPALLLGMITLIGVIGAIALALAFGEYFLGGSSDGSVSVLAQGARSQIDELLGWSIALLQRPHFLVSTFLGGLAYYLLRAHQLGETLALGRMTWPEQVAAADAATFGGLILGNGGTGKTTLVDYLYQDYLSSQLRLLRQGDLAQLGGPELVDKYYKSKVGVGGAIAPYRVTGAATAYVVGYRRELVDTPGQAWRFKWTDPGGKNECSASAWSKPIEEAMTRDHALIVNVMTYGYGAAARRPEIYKAFSGAAGFDKNRFLDVTRAAEEKALGHVVDEIRRCIDEGRRPRKLTFVNLVNMGGFWWPEYQTVKAHYEGDLQKYWGDLKGLPSIREKRVAPFLPAGLLFDDMTMDHANGAEACRTPVFCVVPQVRLEVMTATVRAIKAIERALYGQKADPGGAEGDL